jgi:hypothetical protein
LTIFAKKKSFSSKLSEAKNQRVKKIYLKGALDSANFLLHEKSNYIALRYNKET